uniref:Uncharacterized protein n=1 Tax=Oryctolagus cuniculus TaxID=9986 RepID=G1U995_RABIT
PGFLVRLLRELADRHEAKQSRDAEAQTDAAAPGTDSLAEKLRLIDDAFADAKSRHPKTASLDAKLSDYKRDLEEQLRAEMRQRLEYLRETEIARVKMEERRRREEALAELRGACARAWRAKAESLAAREKEAVERVRRLQEIEARDVYTARQRLLRDMDALRAQEAELTRRADAFELDDSAKIKDTRDDSARMKDTSDDSAKSKDTSDDSARIKDTSGDSAKIKDTRDDSALKAERLALQAQNQLLRRQLADSRSENVRLLSRLAQPAAELAVLQDELREAGRAVAAEHARFEAHKQALRKQLQDEASTRDP